MMFHSSRIQVSPSGLYFPVWTIQPLSCCSGNQIQGTTTWCFAQVWKWVTNHIIADHQPRERKMKPVKETWAKTKLEFSSRIFYASDTVLSAGVVGQWHHRPHKPCIVSWLTTNTSSAITMPWDDMAGEQRLFVISSGRTDAEAPSVSGEAWPPDAKSWPWKRPYAGKDWGQKEKGTTEDEMVGWYHRFNGHELGQTPVDSEGKGGLACCNPWGCKESDST